MEQAWQELLRPQTAVIGWNPSISASSSVYYYGMHGQEERLMELIKGVLRRVEKR